jgi:hypothetical protein
MVLHEVLPFDSTMPDTDMPPPCDFAGCVPSGKIQEKFNPFNELKNRIDYRPAELRRNSARPADVSAESCRTQEAARLRKR